MVPTREHNDAMIAQFLSPLDRLDKTVLFSACLLIILVLGFLDYHSGYEFAFSIFYVAPVSVVAYHVGKRWALVAALLAAVAWMLADIGAGHEYKLPWTVYWNTSTRLLFFVTIALVLANLRVALEHERELAGSDFLTGAANSRTFYGVAQVELDRTRRYGRPFSVAHMDVDNFKTVNDTLGHLAGDQLLRTIVRTMQDQLRKSDTVARLGGDEFVLLLPETAKDEAGVTVRKLHKILNEEVQRRQWPVSFSIGLLTCLDAPGSVDELLKLADKLTYEAKRSGKNQIRQEVVASQLVSTDRTA